MVESPSRPNAKDSLRVNVFRSSPESGTEGPCVDFLPDGATLDQCNEIMSEVALGRELDYECAYALPIDEFESKLKQYQERLIF